MEHDEEEYEEPPWQVGVDNQALAVHVDFHDIVADDELGQHLRTLRSMVPRYVSEDLYNLIKNEVTGPYNLWLRGLRGQPLEYSILRTMENLGFFNTQTRRIVIPEANVLQANATLDRIEESKKALNYVIHRIQECRLATGTSTSMSTDDDESKEMGMADDWGRGGEQRAVLNAVLVKLVVLADHLYKIMDSATMLAITYTMLLENAYPDKWFRMNDLHGCEFQKFLYISRPIAMEDSKKFDRHTKLVIFLLDKFRERRYRKKVNSDFLFQQVMIDRGNQKTCTSFVGGLVANAGQAPAARPPTLSRLARATKPCLLSKCGPFVCFHTCSPEGDQEVLLSLHGGLRLSEWHFRWRRHFHMQRRTPCTSPISLAVII